MTHFKKLSFTTLPSLLYKELSPSSFKNPSLFFSNSKLEEELGFERNWLKTPLALNILSGKETLGGDPSIAMAYGGHQFGHWAGLLGDGRARLIGELIDPSGQKRELHLKGSGRTPYSRGGDGFCTLGAAIREFLVSEAMNALGVPTTRALAIVKSGMKIRREKIEEGAIICRVARSHIRVGSFQYVAVEGNTHDLSLLADYAMECSFPDLLKEAKEERYLLFLREVIKRQATLIASWMSLGFIHGVMNTDNMCVSGETIDYGPCAFMDEFRPDKVFSSIDREGRYAWNRQPEMANWNLARFGETLLPLLSGSETDQIEKAENELQKFTEIFQKEFYTKMGLKFGFEKVNEKTKSFIRVSLEKMTQENVDYTLFFSALNRVAMGAPDHVIWERFNDREGAQIWTEGWRIAFEKGGDKALRVKRMQEVNPYVIPRNHQIQKVIDESNRGNSEYLESMWSAITHPFDVNSNFEKPPEKSEVVHHTFCGT